MTVLCMIYLKKFGILGLVLGEGVRQEGLIFLSSCSRARKFAWMVRVRVSFKFRVMVRVTVRFSVLAIVSYGGP